MNTVTVEIPATTKMLFKENSDELRQLFSQVTDYAVTFLDVRRNGNCALGSGTLVRYKNIVGVITCAHVIDAVSKCREVGIASRTYNSSAERFRLEPIQNDATVVIGSGNESADGPDLGFLHLSEETRGHLEAISSFLDWESQSLKAKGEETLCDWQIDFVVGSLEKLNQKELHSDGRRTFVTHTMLNAGSVRKCERRGEYDVCTFVPNPPVETIELPLSYGGTSGGGLWRFYFKQRERENLEFIERRFAGVAFFQTTDTPRNIICHGPRSVHNKLRQSVLEKWPGMASTSR